MHADWTELFELFEKHKVRYLVTGGNAVNYHGYERHTKDLNIWVSPEKQNAKDAFDAAKAFGVLPSHVTQDDFDRPSDFIVMGAEPYRIDLIMGPPGLDFETAYADRDIDGRETVRISYAREHLTILTKAADRFTDQRDVQMLEIAQKIEDKKP